MSQEYQSFIKQIYEDIGINLNLYKEAQMKRRLTSLRNNRGYDSFHTYYQAIQKNQELKNEFIDRITINVTEFYRNPKRWDILHKEILPKIIKKKKRINIWSAACSTGEEPYTIALILKEHFPEIKANILATDLDKNALNIAKQGIYNENSLKDLPSYYKSKYFTLENGLHKINPKLKEEINFRQHDLLQDKYPRNMDLIICRNVLIYFTDEAKELIYNNFSQALAHEGVLFVGSTEQIFNPKEYDLATIETFFYQKGVGK